jgi:O-succinylbenzoate synthase
MALTSQQVQEMRHRVLERRRQLAAELRGDAERARGETSPVPRTTPPRNPSRPCSPTSARPR